MPVRRLTVDVSLALIQYMQLTHPKEPLKVDAEGVWENPMDAARRRGFQDAIDWLMVMRAVQIDPDIDPETREQMLQVEVNENLIATLPDDSYVLRAARRSDKPRQ